MIYRVALERPAAVGYSLAAGEVNVRSNVYLHNRIREELAEALHMPGFAMVIGYAQGWLLMRRCIYGDMQ